MAAVKLDNLFASNILYAVNHSQKQSEYHNSNYPKAHLIIHIIDSFYPFILNLDIESSRDLKTRDKNPIKSKSIKQNYKFQ